MRSGKSYLAAHPLWFHGDLPTICPKCRATPGIVEQAILLCKSRSRMQELHLPQVDPLDADSPICSSDHLIASLATFILATSPSFPPKCFPSLPKPPHSSPFFFHLPPHQVFFCGGQLGACGLFLTTFLGQFMPLRPVPPDPFSSS